jgi:hypothetical protein
MHRYYWLKLGNTIKIFNKQWEDAGRDLLINISEVFANNISKLNFQIIYNF